MKSVNKNLFVPMLAALLSGGCTTVNTIEPANATAHRQMVADKRIITDSSLNRHINIVGLNSATGPGGFLKIQMELENTTSSPKSLTYRVEWFDENGMIIQQPTSTSMPRTIEGGETVAITSIAPNERAKDFRIKLLEPTN